MDAGIAEQSNLDLITSKGYHYVCVSPHQIKEYELSEKKLNTLFEKELENIKNALSKKQGVKRIDKVWERIGRVKEKYKRASAQYQISVDEHQSKAIVIRWELKPVPKPKEDKTNGVYFIRTNYENPNRGGIMAGIQYHQGSGSHL